MQRKKLRQTKHRRLKLLYTTQANPMNTEHDDHTNQEATINHALKQLGATNWRNRK